jgi:hypothetical protein
MQYLVSVIDDTAGRATPDEMAAIDAFNEGLKAEGHWVFAGGLAAPSSATVIDNRGGEAMFTDGPFLESKEYLAGFWIIEAAGLYLGTMTTGAFWYKPDIAAGAPVIVCRYLFQGTVMTHDN